MADSMEVHAEEVGRSDDELVVQDPDFDGKTEETNAADTGSEADSVGSAPSGDGQDSPQETAPEEKPKRRRAKRLRQRTLPKRRENLNLQTPACAP